MYKIREVKYSANSVSIQVYKIENRKRIVVRHIGTYHNEIEKADLLNLASDFIAKTSSQLHLFNEQAPNSTFNLAQTELIGVYYNFLYELLTKVFIQIGLDKIQKPLLLDLALMRVMEPASKLRSIDLLAQYFGIKHRRQSFYKDAPQWLLLQSKVEAIAVRYAKKQYGFSYDVVFYDVTTLYFETFAEDELRKTGFSKDNKSQQPQVVIALIVTKEGFPIAYEVFAGNTFEGHTIVPVINNFIKKNNVKDFTVVADAAMLSKDNMQALLNHNINYIVGARLGNVTDEIFQAIDKSIIREDGQEIRIKTPKGYLICSYSSARFKKDKYEMEKLIHRAGFLIKNPSKNKKAKFITTTGAKIKLNEKLIEKTKKLLGIKGYYTNLSEAQLDNKTLIARYHELYKIEQAFRISKHDLQTRPIYHYKEDPIKLHLLICFIALVASKNIELKTGLSIARFIQETKKITDARLLNKITNKEASIRVNISEEVKEILQKLLLT